MTQKPDCLIANPDVVLREEMDNWAVLFDAASGQVVGINPVGVVIWKHLDGKHSITDIARCIREAFSDTPDDIEDEIVQFFDKLSERGFVGKVCR